MALMAQVSKRATHPESPTGSDASFDLEDQYLWGYRVVAFTLGPLFLALIPLRLLFLRPWAVASRSSWEAASAGLLLVGFAVLAPQLRRHLANTEDLAFVLGGICLVNNVALMGILRDASQSMNFLMLLAGFGAAYRSLWRFVLSQLVCFGVWLASYGWLLGTDQLALWSFGMVVAVMLAVAIFLFLNRLIDELERLRLQDQGLIETRGRLIANLETALENVKTLDGLVPICAHCKKIRDDDGYWQQVETYVAQRTRAEFTHGLCPGCAEALRREFEALVPQEGTGV
jgi:hypothetical protein